jgi:hypothetical protein
MYHAELEAIISAISEERDNRARFDMDVSMLDTILDRANALMALDADTLAKLVDGAQALVAECHVDLSGQLAALKALL